MATKISEFDALKGIDKFLEQLSEKERQRVFNFVTSKYGFTASLNETGQTSGKRAGNQTGNGDQALPADLSVKQFIALKKPVGFYEQIACLAFYLEKHHGLPSYKTIEITKANVDARANKIPNPSLYVANTKQKYGFLSPVGGAKVALSARGEALVAALPDREAVKAALEAHPIKKKTTRANKKQMKSKL